MPQLETLTARKKQRAKRGRNKAVPPQRPVLYLATPERRAHGTVRVAVPVDDPKSRATFKQDRAAAECMLDVYHRRGSINEAQWKTGLRVRESWQICQGIKTRDSSLNEAGNGYCLPDPSRKTQAQRDLDAVYKHLSLQQSSIVITVCVADHTAGTKERIATLRRALDALEKLFSG